MRPEEREGIKVFRRGEGRPEGGGVRGGPGDSIDPYDKSYGSILYWEIFLYSMVSYSPEYETILYQEVIL